MYHLKLRATAIPSTVPSQEMHTGSIQPSRLGDPGPALFTFAQVVLRCLASSGRARCLSAITQPDMARRVLDWLDLASRAPPVRSPAKADRSFGEELSPEPPWAKDP